MNVLLLFLLFLFFNRPSSRQEKSESTGSGISTEGPGGHAPQNLGWPPGSPIFHVQTLDVQNWDN